MTPYKNLGGDSGVEAFDITEASIHVRFRAGSQRNYLYDSTRPGIVVINEMKRLALQGRGLNSFISSTVKGNFSKKW